MKNLFLLLLISFLANITLAQDVVEPKGKLIFQSSKCTGCHSAVVFGIESKSKKKPVDISEVGKKYDKQVVKNFILKKEKLNDISHPIAFKGEEADLTDLLNWMFAPIEPTMPDSLKVETAVDTLK